MKPPPPPGLGLGASRPFFFMPRQVRSRTTTVKHFFYIKLAPTSTFAFGALDDDAPTPAPAQFHVMSTQRPDECTHAGAEAEDAAAGHTMVQYCGLIHSLLIVVNFCQGGW